MRSSFLRRLEACCLVVLMAACGGAANGWQRITAVDEGGFQVEMPVAAGVQHSSIVLGAEEVSTHIHIVGDSGITYVASWFDRPVAMAALSGTALRDTVWDLLHDRPDLTIVDGPGPLADPPADARHAWVLTGDGTRLGVVMTALGDRVVILNTGTPDARFGDRERRNMVRFLGSLKPL